MQSAAPSSDRAICLWQLQAYSLEAKSRAKYWATIAAFYDYCVLCRLHWHTMSLMEWIPYDAMKCPGKVLKQTTMEQKVTHVNFFAEMKPPLILGGTMHPQRLLKAIGKLSPKVYTNKVLPLSFLLALSKLLKPTLMQVAIQLQTLMGLRGGHICLLKPCEFIQRSVLLPPFKHQKHPVLMSLSHVPVWLIEAYLSFQTSQYAPIIPWSAETYKKKYKALTKGYNLCKASHSSRHTFASIHAAKSTPLGIVACYMVHTRETTTKVYIHTLKPEDYQLLVANQDYFLPLNLQFAPVSHKELECSIPRDNCFLGYE